MNIGKSLKVSLAQKEMTQGDLATALGITPQTISGWIRTNSMPLKMMNIVSDFFGIKASEFLSIGE